MADAKIPIIDLSLLSGEEDLAHARMARMVDDGFREYGFITVVGHGVSKEVTATAERVARAFFSLSEEEKKRIYEPGPLSRGYIPFQARTTGLSYDPNATTPPDLMEGFAMGRPAPFPGEPDFQDNVWPQNPAEFRAVFENYFKEMENLAFRLLPLFSEALRLPRDYLAPFFTTHASVLKPQHYPRQETAPLPGQMRITPHTDFGILTILRADEKSGGLQICDNRSAEWLDVRVVPDCFVINVGEMLKRWTNNRWAATLHRVINPPTTVENVDRLSLPFFVHSNPDAVIECLPTCLDAGAEPLYEPVVAGEARRERVTRARTN